VVKAAIDWSRGKVDKLKLEALWVTWGAGQLSKELTRELLKSKDHRVRAAAVNALRFHVKSFPDHAELLSKSAQDTHGRVRLSTAVTASHINRKLGLDLLQKSDPNDVNATYNDTFIYAREVLNRKPAESEIKERNVAAPPHLAKEFAKSYIQGSEIYSREGHCITCHQGNGKGLPGSGFPPLAETKWVTGHPDRLIKLTLKGLMGPIEVMGVKYPGQVPMTPFEHMLKDDEISAVLTYVRNSFGNKASPVTIDQVAKIRNNYKDKLGLYSPEELLKEHPLEK
jgi:mono/diheme cytochrome c family protein